MTDQGVDRAELIDLYKLAIDEYRFQVSLNWSRTQYYFVLNVGIIGIATGIFNLSTTDRQWLVAAIYVAGLACCLLSIAAVRVQNGYYRSARDHKRHLELELDLGPLGITTTPGMGSTLRRLGKVTTLQTVLLTLLALVNTVGIVVASVS